MHRFKGVARKPVLANLRLKILHEQLYFSTAEFFGKGDEQIGLAEVSIVLGDFVFQNQVIPEGIPGEV